MAKVQTIFGTHFCGNEISDYGKQNGFVDYATLAKSFDMGRHSLWHKLGLCSHRYTM